jgi:uncharacterized membrane protein (UPF0127 family)
LERSSARFNAAASAEIFVCVQWSGVSSDLNVRKEFYVFNQSRQSFVSLGVSPADTHMSRLRGLLGRMRLRSDEGLWIVPCQGIHTIGLLFPIDVIYLDGNHRVIHLIEHLGPFRVSSIRIRSHSVLQLPTRTIYSSNTQVGDQLMICTPAEMENYWKTQRADAAVVGAQPEESAAMESAEQHGYQGTDQPVAERADG